jgi:GNAT superfamily N-acetyltransferase
MRDTTGLPIEPARRDEWSAALQLALMHAPEAERPTRVLNALTLLDAGELDPHGILVARAPAGPAGVQVCVPLPGGSCLFWLPQVAPFFERTDLADRLVQAGIAWQRIRGAKLAQAFVPPHSLDLAEPLVRCGFQDVTQLMYLRHDLCDVPERPAMPGVRIEPYAPELAKVFAETLERTYAGSLDCPEVNGLRTMDEVLVGHRAQGRWRPEHWRLAFRDGVPAGVLLLSDMADEAGWDLSYLGVVPEQRRRGLGRVLAQHAFELARTAGAEQLLVAVDVRNAPALELYLHLRFSATESRNVLLYFFAK